MSNTDAIAQILTLVGQDMTYMLPIIAIFAGIKVILDLFFDAAFGITERRRRP